MSRVEPAISQLQVDIGADGDGFDGCGCVALDQRHAAGQLDIQHAAVIGVGLDAEGFGEILDDQITLVAGGIGSLPGNLDQIDPVVEFGDLSNFFVER